MTRNITATASTEETVALLSALKQRVTDDAAGLPGFIASVDRQVMALYELGGENRESAEWYGEQAARLAAGLSDAVELMRVQLVLIGMRVAAAVRQAEEHEARRRAVAAKAKI
jgi:hypothetical protein